MQGERILRGRIYSLVREGERFAAIRVGAEGLILECYPEGAPLPRQPPTEVLPGAAAVPAFTDSHVHLMPTAGLRALASRLMRLENGAIVPDCLEGLRELLETEAELKPRGPVLGYGVFPGALSERRLPKQRELDSWLPGREVILLSLDGHSSCYSTPALRRLGLEAVAEEGLLTGEAHERNMGKVTSLVMRGMGAAAIARGLSACVAEAAASGIVALHCLEGFDDAAKDPSVAAISLLGPRLCVDLRLYLQYAKIERVMRYSRLLGGKRAGGCLAWEMDGSVSSRSAAFDRPYLDRDHAGRLYKSPEEALAMAGPFYREGYQLAAHAIGPRGIESALRAYETLMDAAGDAENRLRLRIEHFEFPRPDQIERAGRRRLVLSVQPGFAWFDARFLHSYGEALDERAASSICPLRSLLDAGAVLSLSTDAPVQSLDPFMQIAGAVEHPVLRERLTLHEALRAYSCGGAWASFDEDSRGTIEVGKKADLALLDRDPFEAPIDELCDVKVVGTWKDAMPMRVPPAGTIGFAAAALMAGKRRI